MKRTLPKLLLASGMIFAASALSGQVIVAFDDGDLSLFRNTSPSNWSIPTSSGTLVAAPDQNLSSINGTYLNQSFSLPNDNWSITLSVVYQYSGVSERGQNNDGIRLGITTVSTGDALPDYSGVLRHTNFGNRNHRVGNYSGTNLEQSGSNTNLAQGARNVVLETVFTRLNSQTLRMETTLWNAAQTAAEISTITRDVTVAAGYFDNPLYVGLFLNGDVTRTITDSPWDGGIALESFTVSAIPEPRVYAALFGLLALGFVAWRRRRR